MKALTLAILFFCALSSCPVNPAYLQDKSPRLYLVKKIFLEEVQGWEKVEKIEPFLEKEFAHAGFILVHEAANADAILRGEINAEVILDGDGSVPNKSVYKYQLVLRNKEVVWKSTIKFVSKPTFKEDNEFAAKKIVEKLLSDWKKSSKQAARQ